MPPPSETEFEECHTNSPSISILALLIHDRDVVEQCWSRFEERYNGAAKPFKWKFTTTDLANHLDRLDRHEQGQTPKGAGPAAAPTDVQA